MRHFDLFSGYGGFTLALEKIYGDNRNIDVSQKRGGEKTSQGNEQEARERLHPISSETTLSSETNSNEHSNRSFNERQPNGVLEKIYELRNSQCEHIGEESKQEERPQGRKWSSNQHNQMFCSSDRATALCNTVGFSEIDKYASAVLKYRWPNTKNYGDIKNINWNQVPDFDLLTGGSPCQDLSVAGKRAGLGGARSGLFYEFMRAVKEKKPKYFIWENVKGALSSQNGWDFAAVLNEMAEAGYSLWWQVLNAKDFGVPQNRERIFVVGFRDRPAPEIFFELGSSEQNLKQVVGGSQGYRVYDTDGIAVNQASQAGGLGAKTGLYVSRVDRKNKIYNCKTTETSGSLTATMYKGIDASGRTGAIDNFRVRRLTPTECERLMGLPDYWTAVGDFGEGKRDIAISDSQRYKLCGNGVVVNVVEEIIKNIIIC